MLLAQKTYVEGALALMLYCARLLDEQHTRRATTERERPQLLLEVLTPIAKSWPSQWCLEANCLAIQVHGGYGYTREYEVEQYYRDNRLNPIHEGTHGIQGLDLLGRKVDDARRRRAARLLVAIARRSPGPGNSTATSSPAGRRAGRAGRTLARSPAVLAAGDPEMALANASAYLEAAGHVVVAWIWLEQVLAADGKGRRLLRRQAGSCVLLLPSGTTECRAAAGHSGPPRHAHAGPQFGCFVIAGREANPHWIAGCLRPRHPVRADLHSAQGPVVTLPRPGTAADASPCRPG